jgi:type I restriction-modification system DNA methylase subunit
MRKGKKDSLGLIYDMSIEDIENKIIEFLNVRVDEKNKYGEVFTPKSLIEEMLDKLPKNVWSNPNLKWLDPANGIGNFPMIAYIKLMDGLKDEIPDKHRRQRFL